MILERGQLGHCCIYLNKGIKNVVSGDTDGLLGGGNAGDDEDTQSEI